MLALSYDNNYVFYQNLARAIRNGVSKTFVNVNTQIDLPSIQDFETGKFFTFENFLSEIHKMCRSHLLLLMLDEFETLEKNVEDRKIGSDIFDQLRHLMQFDTSLSFIFAGTYRLVEMSAKYRGSFNIAIQKEVGYMGEEDAFDLIQKPVENQVIYEKKALKDLMDVTNAKEVKEGKFRVEF